jgi:hypothetical protein
MKVEWFSWSTYVQDKLKQFPNLEGRIACKFRRAQKIETYLDTRIKGLHDVLDSVLENRIKTVSLGFGEIALPLDRLLLHIYWIVQNKFTKEATIRDDFSIVERYLIGLTRLKDAHFEGKSDALASKTKPVMNLMEAMYVFGDFTLKYRIKPARKIQLFKPEILSQMVQFYIQGMWMADDYKNIYSVVPTFECLTANLFLKHFRRPIQGLFEIITCSIFLPFYQIPAEETFLSYPLDEF